MEPIVMLWIALWGLLPPIAVGYYSYRQGRKGYMEAIASRDAAMSRLTRMDEMLAVRLKEIEGKIPPPLDVEALKKTILQAVKGSYGGMLRSVKNVAEGEINELAEDVRENADPEQLQAMMGAKLQGALMKKVMSFFE